MILCVLLCAKITDNSIKYSHHIRLLQKVAIQKILSIKLYLTN